MGTTYIELKRRIMLNLQPRSDGVAILAAEQAIDDAQKIIAAVKDFDELIVWDASNANTTANTSLYNIDTALGLTRPKDIYSIKLMDEDNSRKLDYIPSQRFDEEYPYPTSLGTQRSVKYTVRGRYVELLPTPDSNYALYIQHSQWPAAANHANANDATPFANIDYAIVSLATEMALASLEGGGGDWYVRAKQLLGIASMEEATRPDQRLVARPFNPAGESRATGEYWLNPWVKSS